MKPHTTTWGLLTRPDFTGLPAKFWRWVAICHRRYHQRVHLATLDDQALKDIGVSRVAAARESCKPFWKA